VDVEEHPTVIVRDGVRRDDVEGAGPDVSFLDAALEPSRGITHHRAHEAVSLGDIGLPGCDVVKRRELSRWRAERAHGQDRLSLLADGGGDWYLSFRDVNHGAIVQTRDFQRSSRVNEDPGRDRTIPVD